MQTDSCPSDFGSVPQSQMFDWSILLISYIVTAPFQNHLHQSQGPDEWAQWVRDANQNNLD